MKNWKDITATLLGLGVAIANAWWNIDWDNFEWSPNNGMKLCLSAVIAIGGYVSTIKGKTE